MYNAIGLPIAAGVQYPFAGLLLSPIIALGARFVGGAYTRNKYA